MFLNKSYGFWSTLLSVLGFLFLIALQIFVPDVPQGISSTLIKITQLLILVLLLLGITFSIFAIRNKETGFKKYTGILVPVLIIFFVVIVVPFIIAIGFE